MVSVIGLRVLFGLVRTLSNILPSFIPPQGIMTQSLSPERPRSPSSPTITYHPSLFPANLPTPALLESVAGGAHYSGVRIERDSGKARRNSAGIRTSHIQIRGDHQQVVDDLNELYCCRPTRENLERRWRPEARLEVRLVIQVIQTHNMTDILQNPFCNCMGFDEYAAQVSDIVAHWNRK